MSCPDLGESLSLTEPQFLPLRNGVNSSTRLVSGGGDLTSRHALSTWHAVRAQVEAAAPTFVLPGAGPLPDPAFVPVQVHGCF